MGFVEERARPSLPLRGGAPVGGGGVKATKFASCKALPFTPQSASLTVACGQPRRGSDSPPDCHSLPRLRFAYPSRGAFGYYPYKSQFNGQRHEPGGFYLRSDRHLNQSLVTVSGDPPPTPNLMIQLIPQPMQGHISQPGSSLGCAAGGLPLP